MNPAVRRRILEEAEHLIHLKGYHCTSLDDIAGRCAMTKANLLHHFRSKEELGLAVLDFKMACYREGCLKPLCDGGDPVEAVRCLFASAGALFRGNGCRAGCFVANIATEMSDLNDRFRERTSRFFDEWAGGLERSLRAAVASGKLDRRLKPREAAESVLALYEGAMMLARARRDPGVFDRVGLQACRLLDGSPQGRTRPRPGPWPRSERHALA